MSLFFILVTLPVQGEYYVSPTGNDSATGTKEAPFQTIERGIEEAIKGDVNRPESKTVLLEEGTWYLTAPLKLDERHHCLTLRGKGGKKSILCGGKLLSGWQKEGTFFVADVQGMDFRLLAVNGRCVPRSRLPETGTFKHESVFTTPWMSTTGGGWKVKPTHEELTTMIYKTADIDSIDDLENTEITLYHQWDETLLRVAAVNPEQRVITFAQESGHPAGAFKVDDYVIWNSRHGMKKPGQWYLDRKAGKVYYWPLEGETPESLHVMAPVINELITANKVDNLKIENLQLTATNTPLIKGGFGASAFAGAIDIRGGNNIRLNQLTIANVSGQGIKVGGVENILIANSEVFQTGAKGITVSGKKVVIENNRVHDVGMIYPSTIAISGGVAGRKMLTLDQLSEVADTPEEGFGADENNLQFVIRHNEVYNAPYSGITCGGGENVLIEGNRIHHVMQVLGDGAAVYLSGGTNYTIRGNFAYDVRPMHGYGCSAWYLDEQMFKSVVEKNLSINIGRPIHFHMARNNAIYDNVFFADEEKGVISLQRSTAVWFRRNVFVAEGIIEIRGYDGLAQASDNIFFSKKEEVILVNQSKGYSEQTKTKADSTTPGFSLTAPPILSDPQSGKILFGESEMIKQFGIAPLDVSQAGAP